MVGNGKAFKFDSKRSQEYKCFLYHTTRDIVTFSLVVWWERVGTEDEIRHEVAILETKKSQEPHLGSSKVLDYWC